MAATRFLPIALALAGAVTAGTAGVALAGTKPEALLPGVTAPGGKPEALPPEAGAPRVAQGGVCTPAEQAVLDEAFAEARTRMRQAIRFVAERPQDPHVVRYFGTASVKQVRWTLERIALRLDQPGTFGTSCNDPRGCNRDIFAYSERGRPHLGFCARFFRSPEEGQDARFGVVIHEMSHLAAGTDDHAYQPANVRRLAQENPQLAVLNADSYEYFVETLPQAMVRNGAKLAR
ncbi:M35 family metallopeptidase [Roseomonas sp. NAR14]|uniref:M35 family metallopeptidase n=1 Tax=Roseomonas acroporae TaxID=2937791 RepID=A0A9X2BWV7_9PROT|nr:M35 family metallopeptidase [Roseomonas acroporae]MCK8784305.1 M35 family metallopeptidase [Roseomonas acroporae]